MAKLTTSISKSDFSKEFMSKWGKRSVKINRSTMNVKMLEILANHLLNEDINIKNELNRYHEVLKSIKEDLENKKVEKMNAIQGDSKLLENLAYKRLKKLYR